jgi:hypothetical protein
MQNQRYNTTGEPASPSIIKNRGRVSSPSSTTPKKDKILPHQGSSPNNNNNHHASFTPTRRTPRCRGPTTTQQLLLSTSSPQREVEMISDKQYLLPLAPLFSASSPKNNNNNRRHPPKAKNSSMFLTGMVSQQPQQQQQPPHPEVVPPTSITSTSAAAAKQQQRRRYYYYYSSGGVLVGVVVSSLVILALVVQSRFLTRQESNNNNYQEQPNAYFALDHLPPRRTSTAAQRQTASTSSSSSIDNRQERTTTTTVDTANTLYSPVSATAIGGDTHSATELPFAIVHVLDASDASSENNSSSYVLDLYTMIASTLIQRHAGSRAAETVLYVTGVAALPDDDHHHIMDLLEQLQITVIFIPTLEQPESGEQSETRRRKTTTTLPLPVFHRFMADLAHYERILYMRTNILARGSMDYLYHASKNGLLQENVIFADRQSPASTDIFLVRPSTDTSLFVRDMFHPDSGWGHAFQSDERYELLNGRTGHRWDFVGANDTAGLLYHYTRFDRGTVSIVLQDAIYSMAVGVDNEETTFESLVSLKDPKIMALAEFQPCWSDAMDHLPCRVPHNTFVRMDYFTSSSTGTMMAPHRPVDLSAETANNSPAHFWHHALDQVQAEFAFNMNDIRQFISKSSSVSSSRFAYAFVVGGCDPDNNESYKNFLYQVLINAFILQEAGSTADIVLFVQMAYGSVHETLPDADVGYLDKMNVSIRYIEKYMEESFDSISMDKFRVLQLPQYERIMFCDSDVLLRESMDYLFELSVRGVLRSNVVFATELVPATGHIFMLSPLDGDWDHILEVSQRNGEVWNDVQAWGHPFAANDGYDLTSGTIGTKWDFPGSYGGLASMVVCTL